jgi:hypothetical protein
MSERFGTPEERYWAAVVKSAACWGWSSTRVRGYGRLYGEHGRRVAAHRFSWELHFGPIPPGMHVLHRCDNPPCTNPDHLFLGTQADNLADGRTKGRVGHFTTDQLDARPQNKLTGPQVLAMRTARQAGEQLKSIAARFGVSRWAARKAIGGASWQWVDGSAPND